MRYTFTKRLLNLDEPLQNTAPRSALTRLVDKTDLGSESLGETHKSLAALPSLGTNNDGVILYRSR